MSRLSVSCLALGSFLVGAAAMFTVPQLIPEAEAGRNDAPAEAFAAPPMREGTSPTKWEYFYVGAHGSALEPAQALGAEGWEAVSYSSSAWVFKRPLP